MEVMMHVSMRMGTFTASCFCSLLLVSSPTYAENSKPWIIDAGSAIYVASPRLERPDASTTFSEGDSPLVAAVTATRREIFDPVATGSIAPSRSYFLEDHSWEESVSPLVSAR
jgi:hypothetical protein